MAAVPLDVDRECRPQFPSLSSGYIFADNAGGSQCLKEVVDRISDYLLNTNVQLGADYSVSKISTDRVMLEAPQATALLINAASLDEIVFGHSTTMNIENLARALENDFQSGEEIIITSEHEANVGPWDRAAKRRGLTVHKWLPRASSPENPYAVKLHISDLTSLISRKTRFVAFTACSNILGEFIDVKSVTHAIREAAKAKGAPKVQVCIDCVAYAPHRKLDVQDWDVDFAVLSYYKVYGPHISAMYARKDAHPSITTLAHYFHDPTAAKSYRLQPGGPGYEITYATSGVLPYLLSLGGTAGDDHTKLKIAFERIAKYEQKLMEPLIKFLLENKDKGVRIVGPETADHTVRAPTISFVVRPQGKPPVSSKWIVGKFDTLGNIGIRYGHFYAHRLLKDLGLDPDDGVVRISLVHYNTVAEVKRMIGVLAGLLQ
jgi:cysteine desulfurase family protein (TIGR01976 family)